MENNKVVYITQSKSDRFTIYGNQEARQNQKYKLKPLHGVSWIREFSSNETRTGHQRVRFNVFTDVDET